MGSWSLLSYGLSTLSLDAFSVGVAPSRLSLPPVRRVIVGNALGYGGIYAGAQVQAPELSLVLDCHRRDAVLPALRAALLPYLRPENNNLILRYAGALRTIQTYAYYVDGLDDLAPRFVLANPRWRRFIDEDNGEVEPGGAWTINIYPEGTAATYPYLSVAGPGSVSYISISAGSFSSSRLTFNNLTLASGETLYCYPEKMRFYTIGSANRDALPYLAPGSKPSSFVLIPGVTNIATLQADTTVSCSYNYIPQYWSWEDADV